MLNVNNSSSYSLFYKFLSMQLINKTWHYSLLNPIENLHYFIMKYSLILITKWYISTFPPNCLVVAICISVFFMIFAFSGLTNAMLFTGKKKKMISLKILLKPLPLYYLYKINKALHDRYKKAINTNTKKHAHVS